MVFFWHGGLSLLFRGPGLTLSPSLQGCFLTMTVPWYQSLIKVLLSRFPQSCCHFHNIETGTQYLVRTRAPAPPMPQPLSRPLPPDMLPPRLWPDPPPALQPETAPLPQDSLLSQTRPRAPACARAGCDASVLALVGLPGGVMARGHSSSSISPAALCPTACPTVLALCPCGMLGSPPPMVLALCPPAHQGSPPAVVTARPDSLSCSLQVVLNQKFTDCFVLVFLDSHSGKTVRAAPCGGLGRYLALQVCPAGGSGREWASSAPAEPGGDSAFTIRLGSAPNSELELHHPFPAVLSPERCQLPNGGPGRGHI